MVSWPKFRRVGPIGIDLGSRSIKLVQMNGDRTRILESVRWDLPIEPAADAAEQFKRWTTALVEAREGRKFVGRECIVCLGAGLLAVQNVRVTKPAVGELEPVILRELGGLRFNRKIAPAGGLAETAQIRHNYTKQGGQVGQLMLPKPAVQRITVQKHKRQALTLVLIKQICAINDLFGHRTSF